MRKAILGVTAALCAFSMLARANEPAAVAAPGKSTVAAAKPAKAPPGYVARKIAGNVVYCKSTAILGSRVPKTICLSADEIESLQRNTDSAMTDMNQKIRVCVDPNACGAP